MRLSCAGKTFLLGEYLAMDGGPSILASTGPRFEMQFEKNAASLKGASSASSKKHPFHADSPAGLLFREHQAQLQDIEISFLDPYQGLGGLGASSAQFLLLYAYCNNWASRTGGASSVHLNADGVLQSSQMAGKLVRGSVDEPASQNSNSRAASALHPRIQPLEWPQIFQDYRDCAWNGEGIAPSGADLVSQATGQITVFDGRTFQASEYAWPFVDLEFTLIRTGLKLATHEHLRRHKDVLPHDQMRVFVGHAIEALKEAFVLQSRHAGEAFCAAVTDFADVLRNSGLTADKSLEMLEKVKCTAGVLAVKGCGAMGADILLVLHEPGVDIALPKGASIAGRSRDLSGGLKIDGLIF